MTDWRALIIKASTPEGASSEAPPSPVHLDEAVFASQPRNDVPVTSLTLLAYPHVFFYDRRGADKPWLQENPEPVSEFVWDSWLEIHPRIAEALGIRQNDLVNVKSPLGNVQLAANLHSRISQNTVAAPLGQGHTDYGRYASGRGGNSWPILPPGKLHVPVTIQAAGRRHELISLSFTCQMMHRPIVESITLGRVETRRTARSTGTSATQAVRAMA